MPAGQYPDRVSWYSENWNTYDPQTGIHTAQPVSPLATETLKVDGYTDQTPRSQVALAGTLEMDTRAPGQFKAVALPRRSLPATPKRLEPTPRPGSLPPRPGSAAAAAPRRRNRSAAGTARKAKDALGGFMGKGSAGNDGINSFFGRMAGRGAGARGAGGRKAGGGRHRRQDEYREEEQPFEPPVLLMGAEETARQERDARRQAAR